jgi:hypothetical protein
MTDRCVTPRAARARRRLEAAGETQAADDVCAGRITPAKALARLRRRPRAEHGPAQGGGSALALPLPTPAMARELNRDPDRMGRETLANYFLDVRTAKVRDTIPRTLPAHVVPFAEYMLRQSKRPVTSRDLVKAYLLTSSSIQRSAQDADKLRRVWPDQPFRGKVRPEDAFAELLRTPTGQRYLDAAAAGRFDAGAAGDLKHRFSSFGLDNTFAHALRAAVDLGARAPEAAQVLRHGRRAQWVTFVRGNVPGISAAKAGFLAALLGRGDLATVDARQIQFWTGGNLEFKEIDQDWIDRLNQRLRALKIVMPPKYQPFYEHLAHHTLWDAVGGSATTHGELIKAMELAGASR